MGCRLNDLRSKEVINITNGKRMGFVSDIELDTEDARILSVIVPAESCGLFSKRGSLRIPWACIEHIGDDLIIVRVKDIAPQK
jgi:YlmC/YmxH family sporulation protein